MIGWLVGITAYWTLAALYLGGASIEIEGGGGGRQLAGVFLHFAIFLVVYTVARSLLGAMLNAGLGVGLGLVVGAVLLPITAKLAFRLVGVRITRVEPAPGESTA